METLDINKHEFKGNEREEGYLSFITILSIVLIGIFAYLIIRTHPEEISLQYIGIVVALICLMICIILTLVSAWIGYNYALESFHPRLLAGKLMDIYKQMI